MIVWAGSELSLEDRTGPSSRSSNTLVMTMVWELGHPERKLELENYFCEAPN